MFAGRVIPEKGVLELAKAFAKLGMRNAWLMVVGSGWFSEDIRDEYLEAVKHELESVKDRVILTGYVPFDDMPEYYAVADAAVLPSVWEEPASLTVIESLAAGLPLITTDAGGIAETADESCAFVLKRCAALSDNIAECMSRLASDTELRRTMSAGAAERVSDRDYGAYYRKFVIAVTKA